MSRREFSKAVKVQTIKRATGADGNQYCEECHALAKRFQIDHVNPDGLTGEPTLENARLLCEPCHREKTKQDVADIAKAKRREAAHLGVRPAPKLKGPGFHKVQPQRRASKPVNKWYGYKGQTI